MIKIVHSRDFWRYIFIMSILLTVNSYASIAEGRGPEYLGDYSNKLKSRIDITNSKIRKNLKSYKRDKSIAHLDESHNMIIQSVEEIDTYLRTVTQQVRDMPEYAKVEKLYAQIDRLEIMNIRDVELPYLCDQLYEIGQLYVKADKMKAKQCFRDIVQKFTSYESNSCSKKAGYALEHLK